MSLSLEVFVCEIGANAAAVLLLVSINPKANLRLTNLLKKPPQADLTPLGRKLDISPNLRR